MPVQNPMNSLLSESSAWVKLQLPTGGGLLYVLPNTYGISAVWAAPKIGKTDALKLLYQGQVGACDQRYVQTGVPT